VRVSDLTPYSLLSLFSLSAFLQSFSSLLFLSPLTTLCHSSHSSSFTKQIFGLTTAYKDKEARAEEDEEMSRPTRRVRRYYLLTLTVLFFIISLLSTSSASLLLILFLLMLLRDEEEKEIDRVTRFPLRFIYFSILFSLNEFVESK
jgi:hypothetical protein